MNSFWNGCLFCGTFTVKINIIFGLMNLLFTCNTYFPLQRFFGIVRQCGGGNDHPTLTHFCQLFRMLSVYSLVKPIAPARCNVECAESNQENRILSNVSVNNVTRRNEGHGNDFDKLMFTIACFNLDVEDRVSNFLDSGEEDEVNDNRIDTLSDQYRAIVYHLGGNTSF